MCSELVEHNLGFVEFFQIRLHISNRMISVESEMTKKGEIYEVAHISERHSKISGLASFCIF